MADICNSQPIAKHLTTSRDLSKGQGVIAAITLKAGIADLLFTRLYLAKVNLKSEFNSLSNVPQNPRRNFFKGRLLGFKYRNLPLGFVIRNIAFILLPAILTYGKGVVIQPATFFKLLIQYGSLPFSRAYSVLKSFSYTENYRTFLDKYQSLSKNIERLAWVAPH